MRRRAGAPWAGSTAQAAPGHQRPRRDTQLHDTPRQHRRPRAAEGQALSAGHQGQTLRRPGIYRQGPFRAAVHQRHTARHTRAQQHEEHAHERGGQDPAEKEGRHRDRQRRVEEHRSDRALQAPLLQQLHCQHTILSAIAAYCFFPKKPAVDVAFVDDEQLVLF